MPYRSSYDDDSDDEIQGDPSFEDSWEEDHTDDFEGDDDDDLTTVPCPYCRQPVYEDAEYCANCDEYISLEDAPPERKPLWIVIVIALCLGSMFFWCIR